MTLSIQKKREIVKKNKKIIKSTISIALADYKGISANELNKLRVMGNNNNVNINVIRNTLLNISIKNTNFECLKNKLIGPTLVAYSKENPGDGAKIFKEFSKINSALKIKSLAYEGKLLTLDQIDQLANMPTYKESIVLFLIMLKEISIGKLLKTIIEVKNNKQKYHDKIKSV